MLIKDGYTPLARAVVKSGSIPIVRALINNKADVNGLDSVFDFCFAWLLFVNNLDRNPCKLWNWKTIMSLNIFKLLVRNLILIHYNLKQRLKCWANFGQSFAKKRQWRIFSLCNSWSFVFIVLFLWRATWSFRIVFFSSLAIVFYSYIYIDIFFVYSTKITLSHCTTPLASRDAMWLACSTDQIQKV